MENKVSDNVIEKNYRECIKSVSYTHLKIPVIVLKVEGKSVERFTACVHIVCGDGGHDA